MDTIYNKWTKHIPANFAQTRKVSDQVPNLKINNRQQFLETEWNITKWMSYFMKHSKTVPLCIILSEKWQLSMKYKKKLQ